MIDGFWICVKRASVVFHGAALVAPSLVINQDVWPVFVRVTECLVLTTLFKRLVV